MKVSKWICINIMSLLSKAIGLFSHNVTDVMTKKPAARLVQAVGFFCT